MNIKPGVCILDPGYVYLIRGMYSRSGVRVLDPGYVYWMRGVKGIRSGV